MGLDLRCGEHSLRAGSYSGVMEQWAGLLRAYLLFLREGDPPEVLTNDMDVALWRVEKRRLAARLEPCLHGPSSYDEDMVRRVSRGLHPGMRHLLLGTGSTGSWTPYQAREILEVLRRLRPFFSRVPELAHHREHYLEPILRVSVRENREIIFW